MRMKYHLGRQRAEYVAAKQPCWIGWLRVLGDRWMAGVQSHDERGDVDCWRELIPLVKHQRRVTGKYVSHVVLHYPETPTSGGILEHR